MATNSGPSRIRIAIREFTTQWFLIPQGTGILAIILHNLPYQFDGLNIISIILWILTIIELCLMILIYGIRWFLYPHHAAKALRTQTAELSCLASIAITHTTIFIMIVLTLPDSWGPEWGKVAYVMWWINVVCSLAAVTIIPYCYVTLGLQDISEFPPSTQLPLVAALTCAAGGGAVCSFGNLSTDLQVPVIIVSYLFIGCGLPLALTMDALSLSRILSGNSPTGLKINQHMILCGPWGQGSFALQILGNVVMSGAFASYNHGVWVTESAAGPVGYASIFAGLLFWGQGTFWLVFAIGNIVHTLTIHRKEITGWGLPAWSLVFPVGVYTNAAIQLGQLLDARAFKVWATIITIAMVITWLANMGFTVLGVFNGTLFGLKKGWRMPESEMENQAEKREDENAELDRCSHEPLHGSDNGYTSGISNAHRNEYTHGQMDAR